MTQTSKPILFHFILHGNHIRLTGTHILANMLLHVSSMEQSGRIFCSNCGCHDSGLLLYVIRVCLGSVCGHMATYTCSCLHWAGGVTEEAWLSPQELSAMPLLNIFHLSLTLCLSLFSLSSHASLPFPFLSLRLEQISAVSAAPWNSCSRF